MNIIISSSSGKPIYEQIVFQIKQNIMAGILKEGDMLPSMRVLAKELRISVITTKRAYEELEREGFIETVMGKGSFVSGGSQAAVLLEGRRAISELLEEAVRRAKTTGVSREELADILFKMYEEV